MTIPQQQRNKASSPPPGLLRFVAPVGVMICAVFLLAGPAEPAIAERPSERSFQWDFQTQAGAPLPEFWKPLTGTWTVAAEPEHPANLVLRQSGSGPKLAVLASREPLTNFEFSLRARTDTFAHLSRNWQLGFVFRRQDSERYYKLKISAANLALIRMTPPRAETVPVRDGTTRTAAADRVKPEGHLLVFQPLNLPRDSWHTLGVRCLGETLTVLFNGKELQTLSDPGVGSGLIGVYSSNTPALFDDLKLLVRPAPKPSDRLLVIPESFIPFQNGGVCIYYRLDQDAPVSVRVLDPSGRVFNQLTQDVHSRGLNSITWDGQGLIATTPLAGTYTIEVQTGAKVQRARVRVLSGTGGAP